MNGYQYQIEPTREEQPYPQSPSQKLQNSQKISSANQQTTEKQKIKPYINLLITTVDKLFNEGKISLKYLNEKTEHKSTNQNISTGNKLGNSSNRKISDTSSLNNTNSVKKVNNTKNSRMLLCLIILIQMNKTTRNKYIKMTVVKTAKMLLIQVKINIGQKLKD